MLINEARRQEILQKLEKERQIRKQLIENGNPEPYIDQQIIQEIEINQMKEQSFELFQNSPVKMEQQPQLHYEDTNMGSLSYSELSYGKNQTFSLTKPDDRINQQKDRLNQMKKELFKNKQNQKSSNQNVIDRLSKPKDDIIKERIIMKQQEEDQKLLQTCTFQPQLNPNSQLLAKIKYSLYENTDVVERLTVLEQQRQQHVYELQEAKNKQEEEQQKQQQNSQIQMCQSSRSQAYVPIYMRIAEIYKEKQQMVQDLQDQKEQNEKSQFSFKPTINPQSEVLALIKYEGEDVLTRLTKQGIQKQQRLITQSQYYDDQQHPSFYPMTNNDMNEEILQKSGFSQNFLERQLQHQKLLAQKQVDLAKQYSQQTTCSFQPQINKTSEQMVLQNRINVPLVERLYDQGIEKQQEQKEKNKNILENQYQFKPELNKKSVQIARNRSINNLINNDQTQYKIELLKLQAQEQLEQQCSFYPNTSKNPKYQQIESPYTFDNCSQIIKNEQKQKEQLRMSMIKQKEEQELSQCTFKPSIINKKSASTQNSKVTVKGMEKYLEQVDFNNRKKIEQKLRNEKLFEIHKFYDSQKHKQETKQQPFQLSENPNRCQSYSTQKKKYQKNQNC